MKSRTLLLLSLVVALAIPLTAQGSVVAQGSGWKIDSVTSLNTDDHPLNRISIAPDGQHFVYTEADSLCVVEMPSDDETCAALPPEDRLSAPPREYYAPLAWSSDATRLALVGAPFVYLADTDLTVMNAEDGSLNKIADDGVEERIGINPVPNLIIDSAPVWSPDGTQIAVERTTANAAGEIKRSQIALVDAATGEARNLTGLPGYQDGDRDWGTVLSMAWSPDGSTLLFATRHAQLDPLADGLWAIDVESGEPELLLSLSAAIEPYREVFPDMEEVFLISPMAWSPDSSKILLWMGDPNSYAAPGVWPFIMDMETREITPLPQPFTTPTGDPRLLAPAFAAWSPDGAQILTAWRMLATPNEDIGPSLDPENNTAEIELVMYDVASGSSEALGFLPLLPAYRYTAAWGEDGDVMIAGYYLKLAKN
ncbi:MAG TPA: hypothetical protein PKD09_16470 [Aggregatilinea sp.]|uniref:TolB family protein n=1 Tax=Aggregatilinea sp. TaxID=2806333 RepID=UPI002B960849|nr:hypothetical protein [Aggregatilinea sp.]HML23251.1 hypothetical protein [Aggregatilinea sp.]